MKTLIIKTLLTVAAFSPLFSVAQKLPKVQEAGLPAPANIKIDGKATEWGDKFQAYNNGTQVFYSLANDKDNLYLIVKATDQMVSRKIISGGVSLIVQNSDKKKVTVTYPLSNFKNWPVIGLKFKDELMQGPIVNSGRIDSFRTASNKQLSLLSKDIRVINAKGLSDTLVSVYNDEGIKAAAEFDKKLNYVYELAIPLKYLSLPGDTFNYTLELPGSNFAEGNIIEEIEGGIRVRTTDRTSKLVPMTDMQFLHAPTNCSATYTLAKK